MNRAAKLFFLLLFFAASSRAQTLPAQARADLLPEHIQPSRHVFARPFLDVRDAFLFKDKTESILAATQGLFLITDGITTHAVARQGSGVEIDPGIRLLTGPYPTWKRMAPLGALQEIAGIWLGTEMKRSRNRFLRSVWWLPQAAGIGGNLSGTAYGLLAK